MNKTIITKSLDKKLFITIELRHKAVLFMVTSNVNFKTNKNKAS